MKRFLTRSLILILPFILYLGLAYLNDPFNIRKGEVVSNFDITKHQIAYQINYPLFKLNEFEQSKANILLLGDSRMDKLKSTLFEEWTSKKVYNLSYGGGTLPEIINSLKFVLDTPHNLEEIFIGINFNLYNGFNEMDRVSEAEHLLENQFSLYASKFVFTANIKSLQSLLTSEKGGSVENPNMDKEEFWRSQIDVAARNFYRKYRYPAVFLQELKALSQSCKEKDIALTFVILPTHLELQDCITKYGLENENQRFIADLLPLGTVINYDYENEWTKEKSNFLDPFHFKEEISSKIIQELVNKNYKIGSVL